MGLFATKGTPSQIVRRVHAATAGALKDATVASRLGDLGFEPLGLDGTAFGRLFDDMGRSFADIATERNIAASE